MSKTNKRSRRVFRNGKGIAAKQPELLVCLDDRLSADHEVRRFHYLVETTLGPELRERCSMEGGYSYDAVDMLCVWLYGYLNGIRTCRALQDACQYDVRYEFLCHSCRPHFTTLNDFRTSVGEDLDSMLARVCEAAAETGVLKRRCMAVDGTKIAAKTTQWRKVRSETEDEEARESAYEEACTMVSHNRYLVGYNVQTGVDVDSGFVLGYAVTSKADDSSQMEELLEAAKVQSGGLSESVVADKGYGSSTNALALDAANVVAYLPRKERKKHPPFAKDESGSMKCMAGHIASEGVWIDHRRGGKGYRLFKVSQCSGCPLQASCPGKGRQRSMKLLQEDLHDLKHAAHKRCDTQEGKALLHARCASIELKFAEFKGRSGFIRFLLATKRKAKIEYGLLVLASNLKLLEKYRFQVLGLILRFFATFSTLTATSLPNTLSFAA